jgi:membrane-bound transcription factor site-1 protease
MLFYVETCNAGGANVPALNDLLAPFGVAFGDALLVGMLGIAGEIEATSEGYRW